RALRFLPQQSQRKKQPLRQQKQHPLQPLPRRRSNSEPDSGHENPPLAGGFFYWTSKHLFWDNRHFHSDTLMTIRLIVGLGNPGPEYELTRHNAGFWLVDNLANDSGARLQRETKYNAMFAKAL